MTIWRRIPVLSVVAALAAGIPARAQNLTVGDPAPKLEVSSFVKGEPVSSLEPGNFYVVEFWATWCGPCRATIPHLTELQKKHPKVNFIGVSVWEQDQKLVKPFVNKMGDKMSYRVAMDAVPGKGKAMDGAMAKNWMKAAGQNGIPTAFIVNKEDKIAWIGHPASMDEPLEKIVTGSWDMQTAIAEHKKSIEAEQKMTKLQSKLAQAKVTKDPKKLVAVIDEVCAEVPRVEASLGAAEVRCAHQAGRYPEGSRVRQAPDPAGLRRQLQFVQRTRLVDRGPHRQGEARARGSPVFCRHGQAPMNWPRARIPPSPIRWPRPTSIPVRRPRPSKPRNGQWSWPRERSLKKTRT